MRAACFRQLENVDEHSGEAFDLGCLSDCRSPNAELAHLLQSQSSEESVRHKQDCRCPIGLNLTPVRTPAYRAPIRQTFVIHEFRCVHCEAANPWWDPNPVGT
jgi:hypothetical protein